MRRHVTSRSCASAGPCWPRRLLAIGAWMCARCRLPLPHVHRRSCSSPKDTAHVRHAQRGPRHHDNHAPPPLTSAACVPLHVTVAGPTQPLAGCIREALGAQRRVASVLSWSAGTFCTYAAVYCAAMRPCSSFNQVIDLFGNFWILCPRFASFV